MAMKSTSPLAGLLRKSPFKPIQEHMRMVFSCVCLLPPMFEALYKDDQEQVAKIAAEIDLVETEADKMKSEFRLHMPKTLFLPVDRRDLLTLLRDQDALADNTEKISQILSSRTMKVPEGIKELLDELLDATMEISAAAKLMIEELDELVQVGFGGREYEKVIKMIDGVRKNEHNIDRILHKLKRKLFELEDSMKPVSVIFWYQVIDLLVDISKQAVSYTNIRSHETRRNILCRRRLEK
jgi:predicted phosphate transport protein (TIGR00153 family)